MSGATYQDALDALGTLISRLKRASGDNWEESFNAMHVFLERLQLAEALKGLKVIHVAGTKGKGSTCCMVESMLRAAGYKTGLFTSPHMCDVRERIRIGGRPVEKDVFLQHFWDCFTTFKQHSTEAAGMPAYFRFLTLLGFKIMLAEGVDVAIIEVGLGGRLDATNIIPNPIVCGVSSLGFDHMELLGHTLREIATEKAGIFKKGSPALTISQPEEAQQALQVKAAQVGVDLTLVPPLDAYRSQDGQSPEVGLAGSHQEINAALAVALAGAFEARQQEPEAQENARLVSRLLLPRAYSAGLRAASWPGRCQVVHDSPPSSGGSPQITFFLDGAHTPESMTACAQWFATAADSDSASQQNGAASLAERQNSEHGTTTSDDVADSALLAASPQANGLVNNQPIGESIGNGHVSRAKHLTNLLIFNCMQEREPERLLGSLITALQSRGTSIHHALFVPPDSLYSKPTASSEDEALRSLTWQMKLRDAWEGVIPPHPITSKVAQLPLVLPILPKMREQDSRRGAVLPSLRTTVAWLRSCTRQAPDLRVQASNAGIQNTKGELQVLVTGSLYLVGDMLRHLGQEL